MLNEDQVTISVEERFLLRSLIGASFLSLGGDAVNEHQLGDSLVVNVGSQVVNCHFSFTPKAVSENDVEDFPKLSISKLDDFPSVNGSMPVTFAGNSFAGEIVKDVILVRSKLQLTVKDAPLAHLEYDRGVALQFEKGAVTFINLTDFDVIALVDFIQDFDPSMISPPQTCREDTYWESWSSTDSFISLGTELLD